MSTFTALRKYVSSLLVKFVDTTISGSVYD